MINKFIVLCAAVFLTGGILSAAEADSIKTRAVQFSFITPVGTNGLSSWNYTNAFSVNLLAGYAGGVRGAEFSGLFSLIRNDVRGVQFSGLGNLVLGKTEGAQFSGLFNVNLGEVKAWQFNGLAGVTTGSYKGAQFSGLAGVISDSLTGLQVSGFSNIVPGKIRGFQLGGFFNYAGRLQGVQIAPFNVVDSLEKGVPLGFLSFVGNGYRAVELSASESLFGILSFKTGVKKFYNILSVGTGYRQDFSLFAWGYGLGGFVTFSEKWGLSVDGLCYQVNEGAWFTDRLNLLNKLNFNASWKFAPHFEVFGGISWNVVVADVTDEYGDPAESHIAPWQVFDETYNGHINVKMYPGINAGVRFVNR